VSRRRKKNSGRPGGGIAVTAARVCPERPAAGHGYGMSIVGLVLRLVLSAGVSLRAAPRILATLGTSLGLSLPVPHWTTGRLWLLRMGHAMLTRPLSPGDDWAWVIDHSVQIGKSKCLVILGVRLSQLPPAGRPLVHRDMALIGLVPADDWKRADVDAALEKAVARTGSAPRVIVSDHGVDLAGGIALFQHRHPQTADVYDMKHKAACLLKARLNHSDRYNAFTALVGKTRCLVQQTELAFAAPPGPKSKARFMNLGPQLAWGLRVIRLLRRPPTAAGVAVGQERLAEKLGWVLDYEPDLIEWSQWQQTADAAVNLAACHGLTGESDQQLADELARAPAAGDQTECPTTGQLSDDLLRFVRGQQQQLRPGERLPASTEVLESCFGKFKRLEGQQSRGGFTQLLLGFGSMLSDLTTEAVAAAMAAAGTGQVAEWARQTLGGTIFSQRKQAFAGATEVK
jgi:hypothetical protein